MVVIPTDHAEASAEAGEWRNPLTVDRKYYVYIVASDSGTLYVGVTGDLERRIDEHVHGLFEGFSKKYGCHRLVWFETFDDASRAIDREKQIKRWRREKKEFLIRKVNPAWRDMSEIWERPE